MTINLWTISLYVYDYGAITRGVMVRMEHKIFSDRYIILVKIPDYMRGLYQLSIDFTMNIGKVHFLNGREIKVSRLQIQL